VLNTAVRNVPSCSRLEKFASPVKTGFPMPVKLVKL
jgi:hypothetical protein